MKFTTTPETVAKIVEKNEMKKTDPSAGVGNDVWTFVPKWIEWWNLEDRKDSDVYYAEEMRNGVIDIVYVLWHNPQTGKCQFLKVCF